MILDKYSVDLVELYEEVEDACVPNKQNESAIGDIQKYIKLTDNENTKM